MAGDIIRIQRSCFFLPAVQTVSEPVWHPATDVYQTRFGWLIKLDLAGVRPEDVQVEIGGDQLTIRGVRRDLSLEEGCHHYQMEIAYSHFERTILLPTALKNASMAVEFLHGMLLVHLQTEDANS